jgi:23S rRNA (uracil1939-C5)-methyltransferase
VLADNLTVWPELPSQCDARPPCPGCPRYGDPEPPGLALQQLRGLLAQLGKTELISERAEALGYRHRVRLSARPVLGRARLGIFEEGSHRLVPISRCPLHHTSIIRVSEAIEEALARHRISAYEETGHRGLLRAVQMCVAHEGSGRDAGRVQVTFVVKDEDAYEPRSGSAFRQMLEEVATLPWVQSVWTNLQSRPTNTLLGPDFSRFSGGPFLEQECAGAMNYFPPGAFGQSHPGLHAQVVQTISEFVPSEARVVEFHAGVGSIGLSLLARPGGVQSLVANEINPHGLAGLQRGIQSLTEPGRIRMAPGTAATHAALVRDADVVIVDPPRKGLEPELLRSLTEAPPSRLIYLSCGLDALLREAEVLSRAGVLPTFVAAYPYFPFTDHVETLMVFERSRP